jgi:hypothetical protein
VMYFKNKDIPFAARAGGEFPPPKTKKLG